jgi:polyribonucleotide nucleotidyltransferase
MVEAIKFGLEQGIKPTLELIEELRTKANAPAPKMGDPVLPSDEVMKLVKEKAYDRMVEAARSRASTPATTPSTRSRTRSSRPTSRSPKASRTPST